MSKSTFIIKNNIDDANASYTYYVDDVNREETVEGEIIVIRGWVYSVRKRSDDGIISARPVNVDLVAGDKVSELGRVWRKTRRDVRKSFNLDNDYKAEFLIRFNRAEALDDVIYIRFREDRLSVDEADASGNIESSKNLLEMYVDINMSGLDKSFTKEGRFREFLSNRPLQRTVQFLKNNNPVNAIKKINEKVTPPEDAYEVWRKNNTPSPAEYDRQRKERFAYNPLISISIPLYNTPIEFFEVLMESIVNQTYSNFQLCLADGSDTDTLGQYIKEHYPDDNRIDYMHLSENLGIAGNTNKALAMAKGDYIMLTDHDDILEISAVYEIVKALNTDITDNAGSKDDSTDTGSNIDIVYTDEDLVDASGTIYSNYRFKSDFNLEMLRHLNYVCHIFCVRRSILDEVGGFREKFDGAQDFDLILRCVEKTDRIYHIPNILYHWRAHEDSTAGNIDSKQYAIDASVNALKEHYERVGIEAEVEPTDIFIMLKTMRKVLGEPLVSILIPNKDHITDLEKCITSITDKTEYKNYEIIIIENNSTEAETFAYYDKLTSDAAFKGRIKVCRYEGEFNYSKINNFGAEFAAGEYYILLNNDIEVISSDWIDRMLGYCQDKNIGAVGCKLLYPDDTIQHCGIVIGLGGFAGHILTGLDIREVAYFGRLKVQQEISAVTAACMMVDASIYEEVGGFDEEFAVALNDVDLCLKIRAKGKKIILDPNIQMYHYESKTRGYEESKEQVERFKREIERFKSKWSEVIEAGDPYYNPNLTLIYGNFAIKQPDEKFGEIEAIDD